MENPSSTSNSDLPALPGRFPWALAGAALILLAVEIALRFVSPQRIIPYASGLAEHLAIANCIADVGPADVAFIGSSLTRDGIIAPLVRAELETAFECPVYVASYAASALVMDETLAIVKYMIRKNASPSLLLCELSPQQFRRAVSSRLGATTIFWDINDLAKNISQKRPDSTRAIPMFLRREVGQYWITLRYREALRQWIQQALRLIDKPSIPMLGDYPGHWNRRSTASLADPARRKSLVQRWLQRNVHDGQYSKIDHRLVARLDQTLLQCRQYNIPIVLYEMPLSPALKQKMPPDVYREFYALVADLARKHQVPLYLIDDLGLKLGNEHFADAVHMNRHGAALLTDALTQKVVLPRLAPPSTDQPRLSFSLP